MIRVYYIYFQKNRDKKYGNIYILLKKKIITIIFVLIKKYIPNFNLK